MTALVTPPPTGLPSSSWISFSPDAPTITASPEKAMPSTPRSSTRVVSGRSYARPRPTTYKHKAATSLPSIQGPAVAIRRAESHPDVFSPESIVMSEAVDTGARSPKRLSIFIPPKYATAILASSPTSSEASSDDSSDYHSSMTSASHLGLSESPPTSLSSTTTTSPGILDTLFPRTPLYDHVFTYPDWVAGKNVTSGVIETDAGSLWEEELFSTLETTPRKKSKISPFKTRQSPSKHPFRSGQPRSPTSPGYRSGVRSRRPSAAPTVRRASAIDPPLLVDRRRSSTVASKKVSRKEVESKKKKEMLIPYKNAGGYDVEALDQFFGVTPEAGKALRCGYAGYGLEGREGWKGVDEFQSLLRSSSPTEERAPKMLEKDLEGCIIESRLRGDDNDDPVRMLAELDLHSPGYDFNEYSEVEEGGLPSARSDAPIVRTFRSFDVENSIWDDLEAERMAKGKKGLGTKLKGFFRRG